jgi:hypothetical protein
VQRRRGADRVARQRGHRRGLRALPADVADHHRPLAVAGAEAVVEVAADLVALAGGDVARGQVDPGHVGQHRRQQRALERAGDAGPLLVEARVVDRERGALGEVVEQRLVVAPHQLGEAERHHAHGAAARPHRDQQGALHGEVPEQLAVALVHGRQVRSAGVREQPRLAGGEHVEQRVRAAVGERIALDELVQLLLVGGVARDAGDAADGGGRAAEQDHARVGQVAHRQARERLEDPLLVEHGVEAGARLGQEGGALEQPLALGLRAGAGGDVAADDDHLGAAPELERARPRSRAARGGRRGGAGSAGSRGR